MLACSLETVPWNEEIILLQQTASCMFCTVDLSLIIKDDRQPYFLIARDYKAVEPQEKNYDMANLWILYHAKELLPG